MSLHVVTNVPIGLENITADSFSKMTPVATALFIDQAVNGVEGVQSWNDVGLMSDKQAAHTSAQQLVTAAGLDMLPVHMASDTTYKKWLNEKLSAAEQRGVIRVGEEAVNICRTCEAPQSLAGAVLSREVCVGCGDELRHAEAARTVMTLALPQTDEDRSVHIMNLPGNWRGQLATLPERILISKRRVNGVALDDLGLNGLSVDPKVINAGMAVYSAEVKGADTAWAVVDGKHLNKVAPYADVFMHPDSPAVGFLAIARMPVRELLAEPALSRLSVADVMLLSGALALSGGSWLNRVDEVRAYARRLAHQLQNGLPTLPAKIKGDASTITHPQALIQLLRTIPTTVRAK